MSDAPAPVEGDVITGDKRVAPPVNDHELATKAPRGDDAPVIVTSITSVQATVLPAEAAEAVPSVITSATTVTTSTPLTTAEAPLADDTAFTFSVASPPVASLAVVAASTVGQDFTQPGPFATVVGTDTLLIPNTQVHLYLTITAPKVTSTFEKFPVVLFINGFEMKEAYYKPYADRVASYGYVVLQYDIKQLLPVDVGLEVTYIENLKDKVIAKAATPGDLLYGIVDASTWATMGHSRGGKLAAIQLATYDYVKTSCLIDPVDLLDPSAVSLLAGKGKLAALVGCGITGPANPAKVNYKTFEPVLADGCWVQVITQAGHAQVVDLPTLEAEAADLLCGYGKITHAHAIALATVPCVAWLEKFFHPATDLRGFDQWVSNEVAANEISFTVTPQAAPVPVAFDFEALNAAHLGAA